MILRQELASSTEATGDSPAWLNEEQQRTWRSWLALSAQLPTALSRQLQGGSSLSLQDFEVLVHLTDTEEGRCRAGALAVALQWERSRMSHHVKRMEARGLVAREDCEDDKRAAVVQITDTGRQAIVSAAPHHVALVHQLMFDEIPADELAAVQSYLERALERLHDRQRIEGVPVPPAAPHPPSTTNEKEHACP